MVNFSGSACRWATLAAIPAGLSAVLGHVILPCSVAGAAIPVVLSAVIARVPAGPSAGVGSSSAGVRASTAGSSFA